MPTEITTTTNTAIWKYELEITELQTVQMPAGASILHADNQHGVLCIWVMVDPNARKEGRCIEIIGTGHSIMSATRRFIGTVLMGPLVWHVFDWE